MPLSATCRNCGLSKTPDFYAENYCKECTDFILKSRDAAIKANEDPGAAVRNALAARAHDVHRNRTDPRFPIQRADYWSRNPNET